MSTPILGAVQGAQNVPWDSQTLSGAARSHWEVPRTLRESRGTFEGSLRGSLPRSPWWSPRDSLGCLWLCPGGPWWGRGRSTGFHWEVPAAQAGICIALNWMVASQLSQLVACGPGITSILKVYMMKCGCWLYARPAQDPTMTGIGSRDRLCSRSKHD